MNSELVKRIQILLKHYELGVSAFADKIGIQRSTMSHILSGRNRPSLDFVMKVIHAFPEVDLYWLLNGKGHFPDKNEGVQKTLPPIPTDGSMEENPIKVKDFLASRELEKIVFFYSDGSFETFSQKKR